MKPSKFYEEPMDQKYRLVHSDALNQAAPASPKAQLAPKVRLERKGRGGKSVTIVERLNRSDDELKKILKALQQACGTGGTVKQHHIEIQGDFEQKIRVVLPDILKKK